MFKMIGKKIKKTLSMGHDVQKRRLMDVMANKSGEHYVTVSDSMNTILKLETQNGISN